MGYRAVAARTAADQGQIMRWTLLSLAALLAPAGPAVAAQGEVCLASTPASPAGIMPPFDDSTVFQCKSAGAVTVPQLYAKGWRVVSVFPQSSLDPSKPGMATVAWTVVVEKI